MPQNDATQPETGQGTTDVTRAQADVEAWTRWKQSRSQADLETLMRRMSPVIGQQVNRWSGTGSRVLLENEGKKEALKAFETYDPSRGTQLSTHVVSRLQKLSRHAYARRSTLAVPEDHQLAYAHVRRAAAALEDRFGRPPSDEALADHLGIPLARLQDVSRRAGTRELMEHGAAVGIENARHDRLADMVEFAYQKMGPQERRVFDMRTGSHGVQEAESDEEIRQATKMTQGQLSWTLLKTKKLLEEASKLRTPQGVSRT